jgi:hypothetical protein
MARRLNLGGIDSAACLMFLTQAGFLCFLAMKRVNAVNQFTGLMVPFFLCFRGQFRWLGRLSYAATGIL